MRNLVDLLHSTTDLLPSWLVIALAAVAGWFIFPAWWNSVRVRQIRATLRKATQTNDTQRRQALLEEAYQLAGDEGSRWIVVAEEATSRVLPSARERALNELNARSIPLSVLDHLQKEKTSKEKIDGHPLEAILGIERLRREGLLEAAHVRLTQARKRFPDDAELAELEVELNKDA